MADNPTLLCHVGPKTALAISQGKVISGCGGELFVFDRAANELEARINVFSGCSIHGFQEGKSSAGQILLCVFGAKQARIVSVNLTQQHVTDSITFESAVLETNDWIWDACWILGEDKTSGNVALAIAHNSVQLWNWKCNEIIGEQKCKENCILYCAHLVGTMWTNLIVMAGTVFNKIVLWPVSGDEEQAVNKDQEAVDVMHTFAGHKGVIFSVKYHQELRRLCSVSDDRSIRMWQLSFPEGSSTPTSIADWKQMNSHLIFSLYGHAARVWDIVMMSTCFASVGEDATCLLWNYSGNIIQKFQGHKGKSIWSLAASDDEKYVVTGGGDASIRVWEVQQSSHLETVSSLVPLHLLKGKDDFPRTIEMLDFNTVLIMMNSGALYKFNVQKQDLLVAFSDANFISYSVMCPCPTQYLCAIGNIKGTLRVVDFKDNNVKFKDVPLFDGKVLSLVWVKDNLLLCSGPNGQCLLTKIYNGGYGEEAQCCQVKVTQNLSLPASKHRWITGASCVSSLVGSETKTYLVCGDKNGSVFLYPFLEENCPTDKANVEPLQSFYRIHGKAGVTSVCERGGSIFTTGRDGFYREWKVQEGLLVQLHGNKVLKGLDWIEQLSWCSNDFQVYGFFSAHFVVWSVSQNQQLVSIPCGGGHRSWGFWSQEDKSRFVYLKNGEACIVDCWSHCKQSLLHPPLHGREICDVKFVPLQEDNYMPILCSGSEDTTITVSAFINKNNLTQWKPLTHLKGHLSSVRTLSLCNLESKVTATMNETGHCSSFSSILFSGGGRAELRAWKLNILNFKEVIITEDTESATSEPKSVKSSMDMPTCSDFDAVMADHTPCLKQKVNQHELVCKHEHLSTYFLGEPRHKMRYGSWKTRKLKLDPETRVMAIHASPLHELVAQDKTCGSKLSEAFGSSTNQSLHNSDVSEQYILSVAGSDGYLRFLSFNLRSKTFHSIATTFYHKCCVLKTFHYIHLTQEGQVFPFTFSASTRGDIAIWNLSNILLQHVMKPTEKTNADHEEEEDYVSFLQPSKAEHLRLDSEVEEDLQPILCLKAHQSGVNSLHSLQISDSNTLVASGGDDNSISMHSLIISNSQVGLVTKGFKKDAHSAQITGIWLVSKSIMVSTSIDQRVNVWRLTHLEDSIEVDMIACKYIDIADVSCMDVFIKRNSIHLCVAGEGMCLLNLDQVNL